MTMRNPNLKPMIGLWILVLAPAAFGRQSNQSVSRKAMPSSHEALASTNSVIVKMKSGLGKNAEPGWMASLSAVGAVSTTPTFPGHMMEKQDRLSRVYTVKLLPGLDAIQAAEILSKNPDVVWAEPDCIRKLHYIPDDPGFPYQWYLPLIGMPSAWDTYFQSAAVDAPVVIGIVDTGIDFTNPDILPNLWRNDDEIAGNGFDDDQNGYIDDVNGWDFGDGDNQPLPSTMETAEDRWHGTAVAGFAGAVTDNGFGFAAPPPSVRLMALKSAQDSDIDQYVVSSYLGIAYAADNGADIINCSFGGSYNRVEEEAVAHACSLGVLVVASAGNTATNEPEYPARYPQAFSVGASDSTDRLASFSNYGYGLDAVAPGKKVIGFWGENTYALISGTSFSAPLVSGSAALIKSLHPGWNGLQAGEQLRATADAVDALNPSHAGMLGAGRINAARAASEHASSIRISRWSFNESEGNGNGLFEAGETIAASWTVKNFLLPADGAVVVFQCADPDVSILNPSHAIGSLGTMEEKTGEDSLRIKIADASAKDRTVWVEARITASGGYAGSDDVDFYIPMSSPTIASGRVRLTLSSIGRLGIVDMNRNIGEGFIFGTAGNMLFEGAFMAATDSFHVSDAARSDVSNEQNKDFDTSPSGEIVLWNPGVAASEEASAAFDDLGTGAIGLRVIQNTYAFSESPDDQYILIACHLVNPGVSTIHNLNFGLFMDWDIGVVAASNRPGYDSNSTLGYVYDASSQLYGGVTVLSQDAAPAYKSINNPDEIYQEAGDYTDAKKWSHLSHGVQPVSKTTPDDYSQVLGAGPFTIDPDDTALVGFGILAGSSLDELKAGCRAAKATWRRLIDSTYMDSVAEFRVAPVFPNPFKTRTSIRYWLPKDSDVRISVHDVAGRELIRLADGKQTATPEDSPHDIEWDGRTNSGRAASGVYLIRCQAGRQIRVQKTVLVR